MNPLIMHAATITTAYVSHNKVDSARVPDILAQVFETLRSIDDQPSTATADHINGHANGHMNGHSNGHTAAPPVQREAPREGPTEQRPAVPIRRSVFPDYIICLEDGKKMKTLKRHLMTDFGITPEEYKRKWGLPHDYPMTSPNYAKYRSELAKESGLGKSRSASRA